MKRKRTYKIPHRRRREGKTNYRKRYDLLKSNTDRIVIRKFSNNLICQIVSYDPKGDKTIIKVDKKDLEKSGWKGNFSGIPAAYLIGLICGKHAKKKGVKKAVADLGLYTSTRWSRIYGALKGAIDGGLEIPHSEDILPPVDRLKGKHVSDYAAKLKADNPEAYKKIFSGYLKNKIQPENLDKHFDEIKKKIV